MSDFCPCCDDFSMDASRAKKKPVVKVLPKRVKLLPKKKRITVKSKIVINVDNSDENADWIKHVRIL